MRKRTVNHLADTIFWYLIYFLPVIFYIVYLIAEPSSGGSIVNFINYFEQVGFGIVTDNVIITTLRDIFGSGGTFPLFNTDLPYIIFTWFVGTYIIHLAVDFLLFIPRLAHKWLKEFTQGE